MMKRDWQDDNGVKRRSLVQDERTPSEQGIPLDVYCILDDELNGVGEQFKRQLYHELWVRGMIEVSDFAKRDARRNVRQALQIALSKDAKRIIQIVVGDNNNEQT